MINKDFNSIIELIREFPSQDSCIRHLESLRWKDGVIISPFDKSSKVYVCKNSRYRCKNTNKYFNVKTGTLFDNTKVPLQKWFLAIWLITCHSKGISSVQLSKDIDVTQKTAWFMLHRIRNCFGFDNDNTLSGEIEVDETYIGDKNKNRHNAKKSKGTQGRSTKNKVAVLGIIERGGKLNAKIVSDVGAKTLTSEIIKCVNDDSIIYSDEWGGYKSLKKTYIHKFIKHKENEYVRGRVHTNTIEGFWSLLKRGILGIYHFVSSKHLQKYVDAFVFRYNSRKLSESEKFNIMVDHMSSKLTYKELTNE